MTPSVTGLIMTMPSQTGKCPDVTTLLCPARAYYRHTVIVPHMLPKATRITSIIVNAISETRVL